MANPIKANFPLASTAMTITLASLANSTTGVGRQSTLIDNSTDKAQMVRVFYKITTGTSPTANNTIQLYLINADKTSSPNVVTDGGGTADAGITLITAPAVGVIQVTATSNQTYTGSFLIRNPGIMWGIAVVNSSGVALNATSGNHGLWYVEENQEY